MKTTWKYGTEGVRLAARQAIARVPRPGTSDSVDCGRQWASPTTCLVGKAMESWRQFDQAPAPITANPALHYEVRLRSSIRWSVGWKTPRRRWGGTIASIASSFSVGSPRV